MDFLLILFLFKMSYPHVIHISVNNLAEFNIIMNKKQDFIHKNSHFSRFCG